jgi:hypothetical protein
MEKANIAEKSEWEQARGKQPTGERKHVVNGPTARGTMRSEKAAGAGEDGEEAPTLTTMPWTRGAGNVAQRKRLGTPGDGVPQLGGPARHRSKGGRRIWVHRFTMGQYSLRWGSNARYFGSVGLVNTGMIRNS